MTTATPQAARSSLKRTRLFERHRAAGAKLIDFGGWEMPVQYPSGILEEHRAVREGVGLFDVSHMGEIFFDGPDAARAVQRVVTNDVSRLGPGQALYTCTCREDGGIVDDCIVYKRTDDAFLIIVNASNIDKDRAHFQQHAGAICDVQDRSDEFSLVAVQGPKAMALVGRLADVVPPRPFTFVEARVAGQRVFIARTGYTGEDGVEVLVGSTESDVLAVWDALMAGGAADGVKPIGLGARDTLRLEARLCLYGNDIDEDHDPIEAGLAWVVKGRGYVGEEAIAKVREAGPARRLVGFRALGRGIPRHGYPIHALAADDQAGPVVGVVTSGTVAPTVGGNVGMGYVPATMAEPGTRLVVDCRGKPTLVEIVKGPFYKRP